MNLQLTLFAGLLALQGIWCKKYTVLIKTGSAFSAGTDAKVSIKIEGSLKTSSSLMMDNKNNNFERGNLDVFELQLFDLGTIKSLLLTFEPAGLAYGWLLEYILIKDGTTEYRFPFNQKITKKTVDKRLFPAVSKSSKSNYEVTVVTGSGLYAGTDANVYLQLHGKDSKEKTVFKKLYGQGNNFQRGQTDVFSLKEKYLSCVCSITIYHDGKGTSSDWYPLSIQIRRKRQGTSNFEKWSFDFSGKLKAYNLKTIKAKQLS